MSKWILVEDEQVEKTELRDAYVKLAKIRELCRVNAAFNFQAWRVMQILDGGKS